MTLERLNLEAVDAPLDSFPNSIVEEIKHHGRKVFRIAEGGESHYILAEAAFYLTRPEEESRQEINYMDKRMKLFARL